MALSVRRRHLLAALGAIAAGATALPSAGAKHLQRISRVGVLFWGPQDAAWRYLRTPLLEGLRSEGFVEGTNLAIDWRFSNGDGKRDRALAAELASAGSDVVITAGNERATLLLESSPSILVVAIVSRPVESGFARDLARPAGRVTGLVSVGGQTLSKQLELMREIHPALETVSILIGTEDLDHSLRAAGFEQGARAAGVRHEVRTVKELQGFTSAFQSISKRAGTVAYIASFPPSVDPRRLADAAIAARVLTMTPHRYFVENGGLMGYYSSTEETGRRMGSLAAKALRAGSAGDVPFETVTRYELMLNLKTAAALGVEIPTKVKLQATDVFAH